SKHQAPLQTPRSLPSSAKALATLQLSVLLPKQKRAALQPSPRRLFFLSVDLTSKFFRCREVFITPPGAFLLCRLHLLNLPRRFTAPPEETYEVLLT
ncbi:unnamed protein product, partial [Laminaria digitata]